MAKKRILKWGDVVYPTKRALNSNLGLKKGDYGMYLGDFGQSAIVVIRVGHKTPQKYYRKFWE